LRRGVPLTTTRKNEKHLGSHHFTCTHVAGIMCTTMAKPTPNILLRIRPPGWFVIFLALAAACHYLVPATRIVLLSNAALGAVIFLSGFFFALYGNRLFAREGTEIDPLSPANRALVTRGAFSVSRNPMYFGMVLGLLGIAIYFGTLPFFLGAVAQFCILNYGFIPFEEEKMQRQFGDEYRSYCERVRRWL
jgi:protein-S-isoprenylcysteine O-methyltransferase Ste14